MQNHSTISLYFWFVITSLCLTLPTAHAAAPLVEPLPNAFVCGIPDQPCATTSYEFAAYDLSFNLPAELEWQTAHPSEYFYAIILKSSKAIYPDPSDLMDETECGDYFSEQERLSVQALFPQHKVFAARHGCSMVWYNNVNQKYNFLAVYTGTLAEAKKLLKAASKQFKGANIRKMQVVVDNIH